MPRGLGVGRYGARPGVAEVRCLALYRIDPVRARGTAAPGSQRLVMRLGGIVPVWRERGLVEHMAA